MRAIHILIILIGCFTIIIIGNMTSEVLAQDSKILTLEEASLIAQDHVTKESKTIHDWVGANAVSPKIHYGINGLISAYVFSIKENGEDKGYITISSQTIPNPVLEFSTSPARYKTTLNSIQATLEKSGFRISYQKPLYLGPLAYYYKIEDSQTNQIIEMGSNRVISVDNPSSVKYYNGIPSDNSKNNLKGTYQPELFEKFDGGDTSENTITKILYGPDYWWYLDCIPTSAANVMGYWSDRGYPNLVYGGSQGDYTGTIEQLYDVLEITPDGYVYLPLNKKIKKFTSLRGYSFGAEDILETSFSDLVNEINAHRPVVIYVENHDYYSDHFITGFGYEYDQNDPNFQYMIVHDTWGPAGNGVGFWVQYGVGYDRINFFTIVPPSIDADTISPMSAVNELESYQIDPTFKVSWSGSDEGWGINWYDIQYKDGQGGEWTDLIQNTKITETSFTGTRGHEYYFRSRAKDIDYNQEPYPEGDGDTNTTIVKNVINGSVMTNRDLPIMSVEVYASPDSIGSDYTDFNGSYEVGIKNDGYYSITVSSNNGFNSIPPRKNIYINEEISNINFILPPSDDLIIDGGFESGTLNSWSGRGLIEPIIADTANTGEYAVLLGYTSSSSYQQQFDMSNGNIDFHGVSNQNQIECNSCISQIITISNSIKQPTLSLNYKLKSNYPSSSNFTISLKNPSAVITYTLYKTAEDWEHSWFDLSAFIGEPTQIIIDTDKGLPETPTIVILDDISLGSASSGTSKIFIPLALK